MQSSQRAWTHLQVVLSIFPRVDTMLAVLLGINTATCGLLFSKWPEAAHAGAWLVIFTIAFGLFAGLSFLALYRAAFPDIDPNGKSTVFFGDIAKLSAAEFAAALLGATDRELADQIAHQVWRNSTILTAKYRQLRRAFGWLLASIVTWIVSLLLISISA